MSKKQFNELELQFQEECEVINLKYEYDGYNGDISWAIISNLTEDEILEKYRSIIGDYKSTNRQRFLFLLLFNHYSFLRLSIHFCLQTIFL